MIPVEAVVLVVCLVLKIGSPEGKEYQCVVAAEVAEREVEILHLDSKLLHAT